MAIKMLSSLEAIGIRAPASNRTSHDKMMRTLEHEVMCLQRHSIKHLHLAQFCASGTVTETRCFSDSNGQLRKC